MQSIQHNNSKMDGVTESIRISGEQNLKKKSPKTPKKKKKKVKKEALQDANLDADGIFSIKSEVQSLKGDNGTPKTVPSSPSSSANNNYSWWNVEDMSVDVATEAERSIHGEQSARASKPKSKRSSKSKKTTNSTNNNIREEESVDPVITIRESESVISDWGLDSLLGKSINVDDDDDEENNNQRKPLNPLYGARPPRASRRSLKSSTIREHSPMSTSTYFSDEMDLPKKRYDKYRQAFCMAIILFFLVDAMLLVIFFRPLRNANSGNSLESGGAANSNNDSTILSDDVYTSTSTSTSSPTLDFTEDFTGIQSSKVGRFEILDVVPHDTASSAQGMEVLSFDKVNIQKQAYLETATSADSIPITTTPFAKPSSLQRSYFLESTGVYGESTLRIVDLQSGEVPLKFSLNANYFAKGATYFYEPPNGDNSEEKVRVVQLTWDEGSGFLYDLILPTDKKPEWSFKPVGNFDFSSLTTNGKGRGIVYHPKRNQFIVSDGSSYLHFWKLSDKPTFTFYSDTQSITTYHFTLVEKVQVRVKLDTPTWTSVRSLNDLTWDPFSYGGNTIVANAGSVDMAVRIWVGNPGEETRDEDNKIFLEESFTAYGDVGKITHVYDLEDLNQGDNTRHMNAIAFAYDSSTNGMTNDSTDDEFWITGGNWPSTYRVRLIDDE